MASNWFFTKNGRDYLGPFSSKQLRQLAASGLLLPSEMVLKEGEQKWVRADSVPGLFPQSSAVDCQTSHDAASSEAIGNTVSEPSGEPAQNEPSASDVESADDLPTKKRALWQALAIVGGLVVIVLLTLLAAADSDTRQSIGNGIVVFSVVMILVATIGGLILVITGTMTACPTCRKWWARVYLGRSIIERKKCYGLVTRSAHSSSTGSVSRSDGRPGGTVHTSGSTTWKERVPVIRTTYDLHYQCKHCACQWSEEKVEEVEDFERE